MKGIELITQTINNGHGGIVLTIFILIALLVIGLAVLIVRFTNRVTRKGSKLKIGNIEWANDEKNENNARQSHTDKPAILNDIDNIEKFYSLIQTVISDSVSAGYEKCKIRADLFNTQMDNLVENLGYLSSRILAKYSDIGGKNYEIAKVLLDYSIRTQIIEPIRKVFVLDRLAEKSLDDFIERQSGLRDNAYLRISQTIEQYKIGSSNDNDKELLEALDYYKDDFKRTIVRSLESAHKNARSFLENIDDEDNLLNKHINNHIRSYLNNSNIDLPTNWLDPERSTPPAADTIGEK